MNKIELFDIYWNWVLDNYRWTNLFTGSLEFLQLISQEDVTAISPNPNILHYIGHVATCIYTDQPWNHTKLLLIARWSLCTSRIASKFNYLNILWLHAPFWNRNLISIQPLLILVSLLNAISLCAKIELQYNWRSCFKTSWRFYLKRKQ